MNLNKKSTSLKLEKQIFELERLQKESFLENGRYYHELFTNMSEMFQIIELIYDDSGTAIDFYYREVNPALEKFVSLTRNELIGNRVKELFGTIEDYWLKTYDKIVKTGKSIKLENYIEGFGSYYEVFAWKIDENKVAIIFNDIAKRKLTELALIKATERAENNEESLNKTQEITHTGSWSIDLASNEVTWSKELFKMYGFDPTLPLPPHTEHQKLFTQESWQTLSNELAKTSKTGIPYELELRTVRADGSNGWMWVRGEKVIDKNNKTIGLWGAAQDISELKDNENKIYNLNKLNETILNYAQEGIYGIDLNGNTTFVNSAAAKMIGWELNKVAHKNQHEVLHYGNASGTQYDKNNCPIYAACKNDLVYHANDVVFWRKDGSCFPVEYVSFPIKNEEGKITGAVVCFNDISERNKVVSDLAYQHQEKEKRADELVMANKELAYQNIEKEKQIDELIIANKELSNQNIEKEKQADELIIANKKLAYQNIEKEKRADELVIAMVIANKELAYQNIEKGKRADELTIINKELAYQNIEKEKRADELTFINKELAYQIKEKEKRASELIIANKADQNQLKEKQASNLLLKKTKKQLNEAQRLAHVGSWLFDPLTQKSEWSEEMFHIWGLDIQKHLPEYKTIANRISPLDLELYNSTFNKATLKGTSFDIEFRIFLPNGVQKIIRSICKSVLGSAGEVMTLTGTNQDITAQKLFEEAQIKHQRLKAIGEMSASIAHDFNNALQQMIGNLEVVKIQDKLSDSSLDRLNSIESIIEDISMRVSALQKFGDTEHIDDNAKHINFNTLIEESLKESRPLWKDGMEKEGLKIVVTTDFGEISKISCNSGELKSVLYNLIKNSVEAMPKGGNFKIKTGTKPEGIFATFTDTGIGMDKETQLKIFQPFFSTKGFKLGRGLGMSGVYSIIKKIGGEIFVKSSELNEGTTIEIVFPIQD
jgi:PAS domain S-box-containing protein